MGLHQVLMLRVCNNRLQAQLRVHNHCQGMFVLDLIDLIGLILVVFLLSAPSTPVLLEVLQAQANCTVPAPSLQFAFGDFFDRSRCHDFPIISLASGSHVRPALLLLVGRRSLVSGTVPHIARSPDACYAFVVHCGVHR